MDRAIREWLQEIDHDLERPGQLGLSYTKYGCMLLLPSGSFESPAWREAFDRCSPQSIENFHQVIVKHLKVTHIAINKPIPTLKEGSEEENIIRAPSNFTPLYGDFGPTTCSSPPTRDNFDTAFWVTTKQNGIFQSWAPRWTMFSRGNVSEKARILTLRSVQEAVDEGRASGKGCTAVDLYAGIGYFAFSYLKAGVTKVICWDLNSWSIEGLKRAAAANKWSTAINKDEHPLALLAQNDARLVVFNESNERASDQVENMRHRLPPIRHVNCGLLPTSRGSWQTALTVLDQELGGWVHVHENFAVNEIEQKADEVTAAFQHMLNERRHGSVAQLDYTNRLKSYAPGVMHCVLDIYIPPYVAS